jgi:hypothetical protein
MVGGGLSTMRGEANLNIIDLESYGYSFTLRYVYSLKKNPRWNFTFEYTNSSMTQRGYTGFDLYHGTITQNYVGFGSRFYVTKTIKKFNPFLGEFLPFVELSAGYLTNKMQFVDPFLGRTDVYTIKEDDSAGLNLQLTPGLLIVLSKKWSLEFFAGLRYDFSDEWDGLKGTGAFGDLFAHGGIGVHYTLFD